MQYFASELNAKKETTTCQDCPGGYHNGRSPNTLTECFRCNTGTFQDGDKSILCKNCPDGFYQNSPAGVNCTECDHYITYSSECVEICPVHSWENDTTKKCDFCNIGQYLVESQSACQQCQLGFYKEQVGPNECKQCPAGYISNVTNCYECDAGQGILNGMCNDCAAGKYGFSGDCYECGSGKYTSGPKQTNCTSCSIGQFQPVGQATTCKNCPIGQYVNNMGAVLCLDCPAGYGKGEGESACELCDGAQTVKGVCVNCEPGLFLNDKQCIICPRGWISNSPRTGCSICPDVQYTDDSITCKNCASGTATGNIRGGGSWKCCEQGECEDCPAGEYRLGSDCVYCPIGWVSEAAGLCEQCDSAEGEYSSAAGNTRCEKCPEGKSTDPGECKNCEAGQYELKFQCTSCPRGWYSDANINPVCTQCDVQTTTARAGSNKDGDCSVGCTGATFVDQYGVCQECDLGKYVVDRNCQDCPFGTHKDTRSNPTCRDCPAGFTTMETGNIDCFVCPVGETCGCPRGQFGTQDSCDDCPVGYFSTGNKECTTCPLTTYQDEKGQGACRDCPAGLYGDQLSLETCKDCPVGEFQMTTGNEACDDCPRGRWSDGGLDMCKNCTAGKTTLETASTGVTACQDCPSGKMEKDHLCIDCFEGTYQNKTGATVCDACPGTTWSSPGARAASECFGTKGLRTYTFGNIQDSKQTTPYKTSCELRPNFVMVCPACTCDADARNGFWAGPLCNECRRGFATRFCTSICPGYDGRHDSTICNGNGRCWFGRQGNGLCYCGGKHILDESSENVFVDVQYCPAGKICPGYGVGKVQETTYIPLYYLINYRQYSTFVLQMSKYTPQRGHMWFKRFSPSKAFENTCTVCNTKYLDSALTEIGYFNHENTYEKFPLSAQTQNGFHGENCQYECAVCLNGGGCVHSPHPYRYIYTIENTFKEQSSAIYPTTTCLCSANVFDASHMCCPNGFQPYVYYGKRGTTPYSRFSTIPYITSVDNNIDLGYYRDKDLSLEIDQQTPYIEPEDRQITIAVGTRAIKVDFSIVGPYNNHVYHGTTKEICRACPGLFGKGIRAVDNLLQTEQEAENYWWNFPASAGSKKCRGQGVCDFYEKPREIDVDFMGHITNYAMLHRGRMCKSTSIGGFVDRNGHQEITSLEECVKYAQSNSAYFVAWAPEFYMGGESDDIHSKDLDTETNARSSAAATASEAWVKNTGSGIKYSVVLGDLPIPNADSFYEIHPRVIKRCIAFTSCFELRPIDSTAYRAFNVYTVEKGRGDERLKEATSDRFDTCFTYTKNYDHDPEKVGRRQKFGLYLTQNYVQGSDPFLGGLCPPGYFCTQNSDGTGFKEACPIGYYQPLEGQTRTDKDIHCSRQSVFSNKGAIYVPPNGTVVTKADTIKSLSKCTEILLNLGYDLNMSTTSEHAPYGCYLQSTQDGTYTGGFNPNKESRTHSNGQEITTECFSTNVGNVTQYKCVLDNALCQSNLATKSSTDYVDNICQRCPRDSFTPEGSYKCTSCPSGRVKKISGQFDPVSIEIYNTPDIPKPYWYYIANEGGTESDDCAVVPSAVIHVPTANRKMFESPLDQQFLPVISCPFGYSSQPGTYIIDDIWNMQNIIVEDEDIMVEPYINIEGDKQLYESNVQCCLIPTTLESEYVTPESEEICRELNSKSDSGDAETVPGLWHGCLRFDQSSEVEYLSDPTKIHNYPTRGVKYICQKVIRDKSLMEEVVSSYCYPCPGDSMTGPASSMCSTCSANLIKKNMKISLQKLVMNAETRMYEANIQLGVNEPLVSIAFSWYNTGVLYSCDQFLNELGPYAPTNNGGGLVEACNRGKTDTVDCSTTYTGTTGSYEKQACEWGKKLKTQTQSVVLEKDHTDISMDIKYEKDIPSWYFLQMLDRTWSAQWVFNFIKDPLLPTDSIQLTITDCILACSTVFTKHYNVALGIIPVRVGYARDTKQRKWCVCNEGDGIQLNSHPSVYTDATVAGSENNGCINHGSYDPGLCRQTCKDDTTCNGVYVYHANHAAKGRCCYKNTWSGMKVAATGDFIILTPPPDATGIAVDNTHTTSGSYCKNLIDQNPTTIKNEACIKESGVKVIWYESVIVDNWATDEFPLCGLCKPGTRYTGSACEDCARGKFTADMKQSMTDSCEPCPAGFFQDATGKSGCNECHPGFFQENGAGQKCENCPAGFHQNGFQGIACKHCTQGQVQRLAAQPSCVNCEPGHFEFSSANDTIVNSNACKVCPAGYATNQPGQGQCTACNPGQYQDASAQLTCKDCDRGRYEMLGASYEPCTACPAGYVQPVGGRPSCDPCFSAKSVTDIEPKCGPNVICSWYSSDSVTRAPTVPGATYQANTGEFTCTPCPHSHMCTYNALPRKCGAGYAMPPDVYSQSCYKCDKSYWADPADQSECKLCGKVDAPAVVNPTATSCTECKKSEGNVPQPDGCGVKDDGTNDKCTSCIQCGKTEWVVDGKCTPCPPATPIRGTGTNTCGTCETGYWTGTPDGLCESCPTNGWKQLSKSCPDCGTNGWELHWYEKAKAGETSKGELIHGLTSAQQLKYKAVWQGCCWDTDDYVKIGVWIVTRAGVPGLLYIGDADDYIDVKIKVVGQTSTVLKSKIVDNAASLCLAPGKMFYLEFEWTNTDGAGNFNIYVYNANIYTSEPKNVDVGLHCGDNNVETGFEVACIGMAALVPLLGAS